MVEGGLANALRKIGRYPKANVDCTKGPMHEAYNQGWNAAMDEVDGVLRRRDGVLHPSRAPTERAPARSRLEALPRPQGRQGPKEEADGEPVTSQGGLRPRPCGGIDCGSCNPIEEDDDLDFNG